MIADHHDPDTLTPDFVAVLVVHRSAPALSVAELCQRAKVPGPARRAVEHARECPACGMNGFCLDGARLAGKITAQRKRWRRRAA